MIAKKHQEKLRDIKQNVEQSRQYFLHNIQRYKDFARLIYKSTLSNWDIDTLNELQKPTLEFNSLESYINRLVGEFLQHEPDIIASAEDGVPVQLLNEQFFNTMELIEAYIREALQGKKSESTKVRIFKDMIVGGYSVGHIYTEYVNSMSFEQNICFERAYDPTMTGFDPLAVLPHKGDGRYCFQLIPKTRDEFAKEFGKALAEEMKCCKSVDGFSWGYQNELDEDIILVCDYYEKRSKRKSLVKLSNGDTMLKEHYPDYVRFINDGGLMIEPPQIIDERMTDIETIVRYRFCEKEVLDYTETNYDHLPLIFFDGNSAMIYESDVAQQMTKPYAYHAIGMQKLKNFAGQTVANEIENMKMGQWIISKETIPEDYEDSYTNPQRAQSIIYNEFMDGDPDVRLTPPREVQRTPTPPIVLDTFAQADAIIQALLGSYDASQGHIGAQDLSGKAIELGAMQSQAASAPYMGGFIAGLERVANIMTNLIPKYYKTPRTMPVKLANGKREFVITNVKNNDKSIMLNYDPNTINVKVDVGVNSSMQKQQALNTIVQLSQGSKTFAEFINSDGLEVLLENIDIRGQDELKKKGIEFMERKAKEAEMQQQMMMQEAQKPETEDKIIQAQLELENQKNIQRQMESEQKNQLEREKLQAKLDIDTAKVSIDEQKAFTEHMKAKAEIAEMATKADLKQQEINAEAARTAIEGIKDITSNTSAMSDVEVTTIDVLD